MLCKLGPFDKLGHNLQVNHQLMETRIRNKAVRTRTLEVTHDPDVVSERTRVSTGNTDLPALVAVTHAGPMQSQLLASQEDTAECVTKWLRREQTFELKKGNK